MEVNTDLDRSLCPKSLAKDRWENIAFEVNSFGPPTRSADSWQRENDMVTILYRINEDWLFGKINNRQGQFPANFLEYIPANIQLP